MGVTVRFTVDLETDLPLDQRVCLVGDDECLGNWNPQNAVFLDKCTSDNDGLWSCIVELETERFYSYRFFVGRQAGVPHTCYREGNSQSDATDLWVVRWESSPSSHQINTHECLDGGELLVPPTTFGYCDSIYSVSKGWLTNQLEVRIYLHSSPISMWKPKYTRDMYSIKCSAVDYSVYRNPSCYLEEEDSRDGPMPLKVYPVSACNLMCDEGFSQLQNDEWVVFEKDSFLIFSIQLPVNGVFGFCLDFCPCNVTDQSTSFGTAHILPVPETESQLVQNIAIMGANNRPIGELTVDLLVARPVPGLTHSMESGCLTNDTWKQTHQKTLDIGHRGMGESYSKIADVKENTVAAFATANINGADFIEMDILLTKDRTPVVFHDFGVDLACVHKKSEPPRTVLQHVPVHELTLQQLQTFKLYTASKEDPIAINDEDSPVEDADPFPTLERCLRVVDSGLGFNVEIKFPMIDQNGTNEMESYWDLNKLLDEILKVIYQSAGQRKIVFSSFSPDVCTLLSLKQNKYPVMFLNQGQTKTYTPYKDPRASTFKHGISFATAEQLLGVVLLTEILLLDINQIQEVQDKKLILFIWGQDNNDTKLIQRMRDFQVDGIIYDRIDQYKPEFSIGI